METPSLAEAGWMFGVLREEDVKQLQMNMEPNQFHEDKSSKAKFDDPSTQKKKRTHPGPDAEVIALSPKTLTATNRFICEVCKKGFQREQNLQLHRRGHNLPWKLKQKSTKEAEVKKVYLCPEPTCVHHHPSRALGDLTGIKKHFFRKHGEKKWKCEKCSKTYAVQSDWRAHSKICGTKEYRCNCGTLFSRRDSFVTHQAFCDSVGRDNKPNLSNFSANTSQLYAPSQAIVNNQVSLDSLDHKLLSSDQSGDGFRHFGSFIHPLNDSSIHHPSYSSLVYGSPNYHEVQHSPNKLVFDRTMQQFQHDQITSQQNRQMRGSLSSDPGSLAGLLSGDNSTILGAQIGHMYSSQVSLQSCNNNASALAHLSATALLQKASQVGSSCSNNGSTYLHGSLGSSLSALSSEQDNKHLHELMSSLGGAGSITYSMFDSVAKGVRGYNNDNHQENHNLCTVNYPTSFSKYSKENIAGCDRLTRDFMGVGQIVRPLMNGHPQNDIDKRE